VRILANIESIMGKMEQDGHMNSLYETLENILRKETDFAVKGEVRRIEEVEAEVAWLGFEVVG
jgi:hypothetical protein